MAEFESLPNKIDNISASKELRWGFHDSCFQNSNRRTYISNVIFDKVENRLMLNKKMEKMTIRYVQEHLGE